MLFDHTMDLVGFYRGSNSGNFPLIAKAAIMGAALMGNEDGDIIVSHSAKNACFAACCSASFRLPPLPLPMILPR